MELHRLYHLIGLQPEIAKQLDQIEKETDIGRLQPYLEQMLCIDTAPEAYKQLQSFFPEDADQLRMLYCQLVCACRIYDRYREMQIDDVIYVDTMKCFTRFINECHKKNGRMFFDRGWWTYRQISMSLFRIGALEYEFQKTEPGNMGAISVHIPSDADLSGNHVDISLKEAASFFRTKYPDYSYDRYVCDSWLMAPALRPLLPKDSNIIAFQDHFVITRENKEDAGYLDWLFQSPGVTDFEKLPALTSLQKKVKESLLNGGYVGAAHGEILLSERA